MIPNRSVTTQAPPASKSAEPPDVDSHDHIGIPGVTDTKLNNYVDQLYNHANRPGTIGDGTTMDDAQRQEIPAGSGPHIQKSEEITRGLGKWLGRNPGASAHDRLVAQSLYDELVSILGYTP
jgi:hypothetical protein